MRPGVRMMMISNLGEDNARDRRSIGFRSDGRESGYEMPEGDYSPRSRYEPENYEDRDPPRAYSRPMGSMSPWRREEAARRLGEDRERERMERGKYEAGRREHDHMSQSDHRRPMRHYEDEEDEDDLSGTFRHREAQGHVPEKDEETLSEERVKKWVNGMQGSDGKNGAYYQMDQADLLRANYCPQCDKLEFWGAINMIRSDYGEVARRYNVDRPEFYAHMAKAFLMDKDAEERKLAKYMKYVAGK